VPIFAICEDLHNANHITPCKPKKWEDIQDNQFLIVGGQHTIVAMKVRQYIRNSLYFLFYGVMKIPK